MQYLRDRSTGTPSTGLIGKFRGHFSVALKASFRKQIESEKKTRLQSDYFIFRIKTLTKAQGQHIRERDAMKGTEHIQE